MNYCSEKGIVCDTANINGNCTRTACVKHNHFVSGIIRTCGGCDKTDGVCYTSNPPKVKCTVTGNFHFYGDMCDCMSNLIQEAPVYQTEEVGTNQCEICGNYTEDSEHHLCQKCIKKLFRLLYIEADKNFE